jgi:IS605 OrfB family transposase
MVIQDSIYSKRFVSNNLTTQKYGELYDTAVRIRDHKNTISQYICEHLFDYLDVSIFDFLKEMRFKHKEIPSSFDKQCYEDVIIAYQNKFEAVKHRLTFENIRYVCCELYKRDTKKNKKGDFKKVKNTKTSTSLTITLSYLARYGNEHTVDYINEQLPKADEKKQIFYNTILCEINKFGFYRLYALALSRRERTYKKYAERPIEFKSLTFRGRSRKKLIIDYNSRFGSVINAFVSLSSLGRKSFDIPVKFNKDYHGNIHDYEKPNPDYEYVVVFNERKKQVSIILTKKQDRYIPEAGENIVGIDVNVKHNMFTLSNELTFDYDRELLKTFAEVSKRLDALKKQYGRDWKPSKRRQTKIDVISHKIREVEKQTIAGMCKKLSEQGINHIVMEDLNGQFGRSYIKDKVNDGLNYNRIVRALGISSLKDEVEHIARKYGIAVSTVQASYTSKMCPVCGCIEDENRPNQETFECIECGHEDNADVNAAVNIRNRVAVTVLQQRLLKQRDNKSFEPKRLKREKVKEVLLSFRRNLLKNASGECIRSGVTTFDYV